MLEGVIAAPLTLFNKDGSIDFSEQRKYLEFLKMKGINGLFLCGTTSEGLLLTLDERKQLFQLAKETFPDNDDISLIAHCSSLRLDETKELISFAHSIGINEISVLPPIYHKCSDDEIEGYFSELLSSFPNLHFYIYNIPQLALNKVTRKIVENLLNKYNNLYGIKDSSGDFSAIVELIKIKREKPDFKIVVGFDIAFLPALIAGIDGTVSGPAAVFPEPFVKTYQYFKANDIEKAKKSFELLLASSESVGEGYDISVLKKALSYRGFGNGNMRKPLKAFDDPEGILKENVKRTETLVKNVD